MKKVEQQILRTSNIEFPKTGGRRFCPSWLSDHIWLEYSLSADAAFCYACRQFGSTPGGKYNHFTVIGFRKWKYAKEMKKGFNRHENSDAHIKCMLNWQAGEIKSC